MMAISYDDWKGRLEHVQTIGDFRAWLIGLRAAIAGDPAKAGVVQALDKWRSELSTGQDSMLLDSPEADKAWGDLRLIGDQLLHHASGEEKSYDPTMSQTAKNALTATSEAAVTMVEKGSTAIKDTAKSAATGIGWTMYALPLIAAVGVGAWAWSRGKK